MRFVIFIFSLLIFVPVYAQTPTETAVDHIQKIKEGVILIRIQSNEKTIQKLKEHHQNYLVRDKKKEVKVRNEAVYDAFTKHFTFTKIYFFYAKHTEQVMAGNYEGILLDSNLVEDSTITVPQNVPVYIIDVGDIYFEAFGGHFDGMMVMTNQLQPLAKPFPFYVRSRSGLAIIKRTYPEMVMLLQRKMVEFYQKYVPDDTVGMY